MDRPSDDPVRDKVPMHTSLLTAYRIVGERNAINQDYNEKGELLDDTPAISIGSIQIHDPNVTYGDLYIFRQWKLLNEPAILIGMDSLGLLDTLIIDYRRHELQLRMPSTG